MNPLPEWRFLFCDIVQHSIRFGAKVALSSFHVGNTGSNPVGDAKVSGDSERSTTGLGITKAT